MSKSKHANNKTDSKTKENEKKKKSLIWEYCLLIGLFFFFLMMLIGQFEMVYWLWVLVSSTGKVSNGCIRDLGFNSHLHQKLIGVFLLDLIPLSH